MKFVLLQLSFLVLIGPVICNNSTGIVPPLSNNTLTTTVKPAGSCKNGSCDNCSKTRGNTFVCLSEKECKKASVRYFVQSFLKNDIVKVIDDSSQYYVF